jgi:RNA polymerase sigma factor (sigma-70 family)
VGIVAAETAGEAQLYERHSALVYRYCLRMLGSREDAEDAAQTTFFQAVRALRRGVVPNFEQAWLLKIASNECKSRHRAGFRRSQREVTRDPQSLEELAEAPNGGDGRLIGVRHALSRLPETQRRALLLREWQGRSYAEIARELGTTRPAVEALLYRARRGLARELGEETKERRHAFDLASLLGTVKSVLGGGAAVKLAAGIAAVATVGAVAAGDARRPAPSTPVPVPVRQSADVGRPAATGARHSDSAVVVPGTAARANDKPAKAAPAPGRSESTARNAKPVSSTPASPAAPGPDQSQPQSPQAAQGPTTPPVAAPSVPAVPDVPALPQTPPSLPLPLPVVPEVLPLPEVPQVQVPQLPGVPDVPLLPDVPEPPIVGDVPILP